PILSPTVRKERLMTRTAIVFGVTGIAGRAIAERLTGQGWRIVGVSRHRPDDLPQVEHVAADLHDTAATAKALERTAAEQLGFTWSVARPHTVIGYAPGNVMNLGTSIAVYASLAKETGRPFVFPGSPQQHAGLVDVTDARLLAEHLVWEANTPAAANTAFNVV